MRHIGKECAHWVNKTFHGEQCPPFKRNGSKKLVVVYPERDFIFPLSL
jgi:hypothetical protein